jgi:hypothetical protein
MTEHEQIMAALKKLGRHPYSAEQTDSVWMILSGAGT